MTAEAWDLLDAELGRLSAEVARLVTSGPGDEAPDTTPHVIQLPIVQADKRLQRLRAVFADAGVVDDPGRAVIGRRVTLREEDGGVVTYALVVPGDGDPTEGWISADSPLGSAVLNRWPGETVVIDAPGGRHLVTIDRVE